MKKKIIITDDHTIVRKGVISLLKERFPFFELIEAESLHQTMQLLEAEYFDLIILDLSLQNETAESMILQIRSQFKNLPIIIFSMFPKEIMERPMLKLGVKKYVNKSESLSLLRDAVDEILFGRKQVQKEETNTQVRNLFEILTPKELTVMFALLEGKTNSAIALQMHVKASTVSTFKKRIFEKLSIDNTTQLVKLAIQFNMYHLSWTVPERE